MKSVGSGLVAQPQDAPPPHWGQDVCTVSVLGEDCLSFAVRPYHLADVFLDSRRFPSRTYLADATRVITFDHHESLVAQGVRVLAERGIAPGNRVMLLGANSIEWVVAFWAIVAAGGVVVLGNAWWSADEIEHAISLAQPDVVVADERCRARLAEGRVTIAFTEFSQPVEGGDGELNWTRGDQHEDDPALILFTAGTTGLPKAAVLTHRGVLSTLQSILLVSNRLPTPEAIRPGKSVALVSLPMFHIGGLQQIVTPMVTGGTVVFTSGRFIPEAIVELLEKHSVNLWSAVPTMVSRVIDYLESSGKPPVTSLRTVGLGGSPVNDALREKVSVWFPNTIRRVAVTYGLSEAGGVVATATGEAVTSRSQTVGKPLPTVEIRIDAHPGEERGEIVVRAPSVMVGYLDASGGIDPGPLTSTRWLRTGDVGYIDDDGYLFITDRMKDIVIRGGENIAASHVENVLYSHPAVAEVAVIGLPHLEFGEEVAAAIRLKAGTSASQDELTAFVRQRLASFEVPAHWWFVEAELPKSSVGKIIKRDVKKAWLERIAVK